MTAALVVLGVLLTLAQATAGVLLWRRVRAQGVALKQDAVSLSVLAEMVPRLDLEVSRLQAHSQTFASHSDLASVRHDFAASVANLGAELDAHRRGSRHRKAKP